ncbi:unnamed protein product [Ilex paraguariensis]|uniref:Uncharacterized protein n=1 Tax=Ilex paraguariensis TaxID=185542 RepID=A0ABC8UZ73_9AQUA
MEGERRKRKMDSEVENEEEKTEKFFALIRSTRELRELMTGRVDQTKEADKKATEEKAVEVWTPSFRPEDFMEEAPSKSPQIDIASASETQDKTKEDGGDGLDLKLAL